MREQQYTIAEIKARLPKNDKGYIIKGLACPWCHRIMDGTSSATGATFGFDVYDGMWRIDSPLFGCGQRIYLSMNADGVAFLTPEQWNRATGVGQERIVWSRPEPE